MMRSIEEESDMKRSLAGLGFERWTKLYVR